MQSLSAHDILWIWEHGEGRHPIDQALVMLAAGDAELATEDLARLPIGERDARLVALRVATFGEEMQGWGQCPACAEKVEFSVPAEAIAAHAGRKKAAPRLRIEASGIDLVVRLPTSLDLAAAIGAGSAAEARAVLFRRCVETAERGGAPIALDEPPPGMEEIVAARLDEADPCADSEICLVCPSCAHGFSLLFDAATFVWAELAAKARRILRDVHILARTYGWREADILAMSPRRRRAYLDMGDA